MARGDHIYVRRGYRYSHHGIDCGDGSVIHYVGPRASGRRVERTPMAEFAPESQIQVRHYVERLDPDETLRNAESRLGTANYSLVRNNCEHFAAWACTGRARSSQVRRWVVGSQSAMASFVAVETVGAHLAIAGTASAGIYAIAGPLRRRRRWARTEVVAEGA